MIPVIFGITIYIVGYIVVRIIRTLKKKAADVAQKKEKAEANRAENMPSSEVPTPQETSVSQNSNPPKRREIPLMIIALEETWDGGPQLRLIVSYFNEDTRRQGQDIDAYRNDPWWKDKIEEGGIIEKMLTESYSVYPQDGDESYLVVFDNYAFYWVTNENCTFPLPSDTSFEGVPWEILREGCFPSSEMTEAIEHSDDVFGVDLRFHDLRDTQKTRQYSLYTYQNILNVVTVNPPTVVPFKGKLSDYSGHIPIPEELH